tara:strand:- start:329 stop:712 length:384 start_codon:yes stop_codon:yes gene_type:complete
MDYKSAVKKVIYTEKNDVPKGFIVLSKNKDINLVKKEDNYPKYIDNPSYNELRNDTIKTELGEEIRNICENFIEESYLLDVPIIPKNLYTIIWNILEPNIEIVVDELEECLEEEEFNCEDDLLFEKN